MGKFRKLGSFISSPSAVLVAAVFVAATVLFLSSLSSGQDGGGGSCAANFTIRGTVLNSSFANATSLNFSHWNLTSSNISINVSIYNLSFSGFGELQKVFINQTSTYVANGSFDIGVGSAGPCYTLYTLQVIAYNVSSWNAFEVGPSFPPLPQSALKGFLDNGTIYLQPAVTLNITATNGTNYIAFSNIIFDDALGFPISEDFMTTRFNATVVVPSAKNYTIMLMTPPDFTAQNPFNLALPPQTVSVQNASNYSSSNYVVTINKSLAFSQFIISGNITVDGTNSTPINVTQIILKLGLSGIVPPNSEIQLPSGVLINQTPGGGTHVANYSAVVLGSTSGIYQILEFYGSNATTTGSGFGEYYAYFSNFTVTGSMVHNLTLKRLAGNFSSASSGGGSTINTSYIRINITDSSGVPLDDAHIEVKVDMVGHKTVFPTFRYMVGQLSGGTIRIPILNDSNATVHIFNRRYAPMKFKINVTNASKEPNSIIHIKLNTFKPKKFHANGSFEDFGGSKAGQLKFTFMKNSAACNVFNASLSSCRLFNDDFDAARFDPLKVMVTGKVNILLEINTTGVKVYFIGVDMLASGPPDAAMSENSLRTVFNKTGSYEELFKWGSVAPDIYDYVFVGTPYNQSMVNELVLPNFTIRELYDDTGQLVWNSSQSSNSSIPSDWSDYPTQWLNSTYGMRCATTEDANSTNATCFINTTTNYAWINLPHFSDAGGGIQADPDTTPPPIPSPVNFTATPSGTVMINWTDSSGETGESYVIYRYAHNITSVTSNGLNVSNYTGSSSLNLTNLTATTRVGEGVGFFIDNTTLNGTVYYYAVAAVDSAGNLQNATGVINLSNSYNVTANDTLMPKSVSNITVTASDATVTIRWLNVTQDVSGSADFHNLTYHIYRSAANESNVVLNGSSNITQANISTFVKSVPGTSANSTTVTLVKGTYHFAVTTVDDGARENTTVSFLSSGPSGNYGNASVTPAASSSPSTGSTSDGGGGGGGTPTPAEGVKVSKKWDVLPAGTATMSITKAEIGFTNIEFTTSVGASNVEITVTKLAAKPVVKREVQGTVNQYIRIDKSNLREVDVTGAKIEFKIEKKWFDQNSGSIKNIVLQRYFNDLWTTLDTTYLRSDETHQYFEATSPGLSLFAIVLKSAAETKTTSAGDTPVNISGTTSGNESGANATGAGKKAGAGSKILFVLLAVVVLAVAAGGVFFVVKKKGGGGFSLPNPLGRFRGGGGGKAGKARSKSSEEEEAAEIVKEYESQRSGRVQQQPRQQDQRGRPPEAFN